MFRKFLLILLLIVVGTSCRNRGEQTVREATPVPVRVQFGWLFDAHHLGFLVAQERGYYTEEGLVVTLLPGSTETSVVKSLVTNAADVGQISGPEQLAAAAQQNLPIEAIAAFHRKSPHALISLDRSPIRTPADVRGKRIAVAFGDAAESHLRSMMQRYGITPDQVTLVPFRFDLTPLRTGDVDAITGFATDQPFTLESQGLSPVVLPYYQLGDNAYGYMFVTSRQFAAAHPDVVTRFLRASRRGWNEVFAHPDETLAEVAKRYPSWAMPVEKKKLAAVRELMTDGGRLDTWAVNVGRVEQALGRCLRRRQTSPITSTIDSRTRRRGLPADER